MLKDKVIILGVSGGIAAYKIADFASRLSKEGCDTHVIMTKNAVEFISPLTFETLTGNKCIISTFDRSHEWDVKHVSLAKKADAVVIAPATANVIAKMAGGIADDMLTTTVLAAKCPKIIFPSMNTAMYENEITQRNLAALQSCGFIVHEPDSGILACKDVGKGRLPDAGVIYSSLYNEIAHEHDMAGLKVLITAGPTREFFDPVRYITNPSSGKMGYSVAGVAVARGADVTLVSGPVSLSVPEGVKAIAVTTAQQMFDAVTANSDEFDIIIKTAAVADYRPKYIADNKIKKTSDANAIELEPTADILAELGKRKQWRQFLCGFSMETENLIENSANKLKNKNIDMIVANNLGEDGAGFGVETNVATIITKDKVRPLGKMSKMELANLLLDEIISNME